MVYRTISWPFGVPSKAIAHSLTHISKLVSCGVVSTRAVSNVRYTDPIKPISTVLYKQVVVLDLTRAAPLGGA